MSVAKLVIHNFRNLDNASIDFHQYFNFFVGENGSGKSSLLEALFFLGHGKSFRTSKVDALVCHDQTKFVVSVKDDNNRQLGLSREVITGVTKIKIDGDYHNRLSVLAKHIAIQIVTPESFKLFFGGPKERRRFVDLGMFHVKHNFASQWKNFNRVLKQRNACIRSNNNTTESNSLLNYWTDQFCQLSNDVAIVRAEYTAAIILELEIWLSFLLPGLKNRVSVQYLQGWPQKNELHQTLLANREREFNYGYTLYGAHKFDIKFLLDKQPLENQLSRGQQKLFLLALTFAQAKLIARVNRVKPILLIDDIGAELDVHSRFAVAKALYSLNCQVMITAISNDVLDPFINRSSCLNNVTMGFGNHKQKVKDIDNQVSIVENYKVFHVKHGEISAMLYPDNSDLTIRKAIE